MRIKGYHIDPSGIYTSDNEFCNKPSFFEFLLHDEPETIRVFSNLDACVAGLSNLLRLNYKQVNYLLTSNAKMSHITYERGKPTNISLQYFPGKHFLIGKGWYPNLGASAQFSDASQYAVELRKFEGRIDGFERAKLARDVGSEAYTAFLELGFTPDNLVSPVSVFRRHVLKEIELPTIQDVPTEAGLIAFDACKGGWFESYKIGHFDHIYDYDLNSSYPYQVKQLLDLRYGRWVKSCKKNHINTATYGWIDCDVEVTSDFAPLILLASKFDLDRNYTPKGSFLTTMTIQMARYLTEKQLATFTINNGWFFYPTQPLRYCTIAPLVDKFYEAKQSSTGMKKAIAKTILVGGFYGLFLQMFDDKPAEHFLPAYAAEIQTNTQIAVHRACIESGVDPIAIMVDGVVADKPLSVELGEGIGEWKLDAEGKALIISSGVLAIQGKTSENEFSLDYDWLMSYAREHPDAERFSLEKSSVLSLPLAHTRGRFDKVGTIEPEVRNIYLTDIKRLFKQYPASLKELVSHQYSSEPYDAQTLLGLTGLAETEVYKDMFIMKGR